MADRETTMDKVRKLLAHAESSKNEAESATFVAKAQELMHTHAIDEWELAKREQQDKPRLTTQSITIKGNVAGVYDRRVLLNVIASVNRCKMWYSGPTCRVAGYTPDVMFVEMLYASLTLQMNDALLFAIADSFSHPKTFKNNFINGFVSRVATRLRVTQTLLDAGTTTGEELILRDVSAAVSEYVEQQTGKLRTVSHGATSADGMARAAGARAGDSANLKIGRNIQIERR